MASGECRPGDNKVAVIIDTLDTDTGELRYALDADGPLAAGRLEVASLCDLTTRLADGDAFITLYNSDTNNSTVPFLIFEFETTVSE